MTLEPEELPHRLLSPVDIDAAQLESGARVIVGFGLTFQKHRDETGSARPFVFPKPALPDRCVRARLGGGRRRGAGRRSSTTSSSSAVSRSATSTSIASTRSIPPPTSATWSSTMSRRAEPILRRRRTGYAHAKGRPTFLPCGPWLVPGAHFMRDGPALRRLVLTVTEANAYRGRGHGGHGPHTLRQNARLEELTLGLRELLGLVSRKRALTMAGPDGRRWPISVARGDRRILPAGSVLLTGTPGGTAIRSPGLGDKLSLLLRSLRYLRWPSEDYRRHLHEHRHAFGFLSPGDRVSGWITGLGRQEWQVR